MNSKTFNLILIIIVMALALSIIYPIQEKINLGLDLKGGMDLVYEVDMDKLKELTLSRKASKLRRIVKDAKVIDYSVDEDFDNNNIKVTVFDTIDDEKKAELEATLAEDNLLINTGGDIKSGMLFAIHESKIESMNQEALKKALQVIRNRVDYFGVTEPTITTSGGKRIRVQLPGAKSQDLAKQIGSTAMLEFKLVRQDNGFVPSVSEKTKLGKINKDGEKIYYGEKNMDTGKTPVYVLEKEIQLTGDDLESARASRDSLGKPSIDMTFSDEGTNKFARVTKDNVNRQLAIILDDKVYSAPVIQGPIVQGRAQITGSFSEEWAEKIAIILKAGALPAPLIKVSQISVGPSLGKESIEKGQYAALIGAILVFVYMLFMYKLSGIIADLALVINIVLLLAGLVIFKATLTLPGIAGIILTIGVCVDANVIIFERIKEELRTGKSIAASIESGFDKAFSTILDSNVTTIITALILYMFGTGPVKGFAVTLTMGTAINLFSAIFVVKSIFWVLTHKLKIKNISI